MILNRQNVTGAAGRTTFRDRALRLAAAGAAVALVGSVLAGTSTASVDAAADGGNGLSASSNATLQAQLAAYKSSYPTISDAAALAAANGQIVRKSVVEVALADPKTYGGAWFDPPTGVLHVASTTDAAAAKVGQAAAAKGVKIQSHLVARTFAELEALATSLRTNDTPLGRAAAGQVGISVETNSVQVDVPAAQVSALSTLKPTGVTVAADPNVGSFEDAGCTSRTACDYTVRAGAVIWRGSVGANACSVGYTARNSSGRWVYTAGHCSNGNGVTWGTGALAIGPMWASIDSGVLDASIIKVTNPWFTGDTGGQMYFEDADHSLDVDYEAPSLGYMVPGETVCLAANITEPNGPNYCGTFGTSSDPSNRGLARVNGFDGCHGDSGGGWYWLGSSTYRVAYGLHSRSSYDGCHVSGGVSWFSALPTIKSQWVPSLAVETR